MYNVEELPQNKRKDKSVGFNSVSYCVPQGAHGGGM